MDEKKESQALEGSHSVLYCSMFRAYHVRILVDRWHENPGQDGTIWLTLKSLYVVATLSTGNNGMVQGNESLSDLRIISNPMRDILSCHHVFDIIFLVKKSTVGIGPTARSPIPICSFRPQRWMGRLLVFSSGTQYPKERHRS